MVPFLCVILSLDPAEIPKRLYRHFTESPFLILPEADRISMKIRKRKEVRNV